jgi:hypothetical protein
MNSTHPLCNKCVSCNSFKNSNIKGYGYCCGNSQAYKEMTGNSFSRGAPEGPSFKVRKLDGCKYWTMGW